MTVETATATIIDNHNAEPDMQTLVKKPTKKQIRQVRKIKKGCPEAYAGNLGCRSYCYHGQ